MKIDALNLKLQVGKYQAINSTKGVTILRDGRPNLIEAEEVFEDTYFVKAQIFNFKDAVALKMLAEEMIKNYKGEV